MMQKDELWAIYTRKNPNFESGPVTFTADGLRKCFDQTWESAHQQGLKNGKALANDSKNGDPFAKMFGKNNPWAR